jgi:hypothetical protein
MVEAERIWSPIDGGKIAASSSDVDTNPLLRTNQQQAAKQNPHRKPNAPIES